MKQYEVKFDVKIDADNPLDAEGKAVEKIAHGYQKSDSVKEIVPYRTKSKPWNYKKKGGKN